MQRAHGGAVGGEIKRIPFLYTVRYAACDGRARASEGVRLPSPGYQSRCAGLAAEVAGVPCRKSTVYRRYSFRVYRSDEGSCRALIAVREAQEMLYSVHIAVPLDTI